MDAKLWMFSVSGSFGLWTLVGVIWLFRRKLKIVKRIGRIVTNDELIAMAKSGDKELASLRKDTWIFLTIGLLLVTIFLFLKP